MQYALLRFGDPAGNGGDEFAGSEAGGLRDDPVVRAADGECAAFHDGAVTIEATFSALITPAAWNRRDFSVPARWAKPVWVAPGQKHVTVMPESRSSLAIASENEMT